MSDTSPFLSPPPEVVLTAAFARPLDLAVAAARTCYTGRGIVTTAEVAGEGLDSPEARARALERRDLLARDLYQAGHHTTLEHAHFQFALSNVSRQFLWTFLHSHPFYNSEQVSQRYTEVRPDRFTLPRLPAEAARAYAVTIEAQRTSYRELIERVTPLAESEYFRIFPARGRDRARWTKEARRKALEVARYVLPVAAFAHLYHTVSAVTLLRYRKLCRQLDAPVETRWVVDRMVEQVLRLDPSFQVLMEEPVSIEETPEYRWYVEALAERPVRFKAFREEFDRGLEGRISKLVGWKSGNEDLVASGVREVLGCPRERLSDDEALKLALDPGENPLLGGALNVTTVSKLGRALAHASYTFRKRLSHTADSQDQRHRMTPASRPILTAYLGDEPDFVTPALVREDPAVERTYRRAMERAWEGIEAVLRGKGEPPWAAYLLPNGVTLRFTESADLLHLRHKHAMRLCYNAQEEIWRASLDEALQIREVNPRIGRYLLPPCNQRLMAGARPICPEGSRFCGVKVWELDPAQYLRLI